MNQAKAVRFSKEDLALIDLFLQRNDWLDFSTLARISIIQFIKNPDVQIRQVKQEEICKK
jgi:hypothetical protein